MKRQRYDVVVAPNLYGDILSDVAAVTGGLGIAHKRQRRRPFCAGRPRCTAAPDIAGQGVANPVAAIRSAALLLGYLGEHEAARWKELIAACAAKGRGGA